MSAVRVRACCGTEDTMEHQEGCPVSRPGYDLAEWWVHQAQDEARAVAPKAAEYGSNSLVKMGRLIAQLQSREVDDEEATELGIFIYAIGKAFRWEDAVLRGDRPSGDTLHDIGVYTRMAQRTRDRGGWPGQNRSDQ